MTLAAPIEIGPGTGLGIGPVNGRVSEQAGAALARSPRSSPAGEGFRSGWELLFAAPSAGPGIDSGAATNSGNPLANGAAKWNAALRNGFPSLSGDSASIAVRADAHSIFAAAAKDASSAPPASPRANAMPPGMSNLNVSANSAALRSALPSKIESPFPAPPANDPSSARPAASRNNQAEGNAAKPKHPASSATPSPLSAMSAALTLTAPIPAPMPVPMPAIRESSATAQPNDAGFDHLGPAGAALPGAANPKAEQARTALEPKANAPAAATIPAPWRETISAAAQTPANISAIHEISGPSQTLAMKLKPASFLEETSVSPAIAPHPVHSNLAAGDALLVSSPAAVVQPAVSQFTRPAPKGSSQDESSTNAAPPSRAASIQAAPPAAGISSPTAAPGDKTSSRPVHDSSAAASSAPANHALTSQSAAAVQLGGMLPARDAAGAHVATLTAGLAGPPASTAAGAAPRDAFAGSRRRRRQRRSYLGPYRSATRRGWLRGPLAGLGGRARGPRRRQRSCPRWCLARPMRRRRWARILAGLNAYLAEHHNEISAVTLASPESRTLQGGSGQGGSGQDPGREPHRELAQGSGQETGYGAGQNSGQEAGQGSGDLNRAALQPGGQMETGIHLDRHSHRQSNYGRACSAHDSRCRHLHLGNGLRPNSKEHARRVTKVKQSAKQQEREATMGAATGIWTQHPAATRCWAHGHQRIQGR